MKLKQTLKQQIANRLHVVYEDVDTQASFMYVGEQLKTADEVLKRLQQLLKTQTWQPNGVYWVWRQLEATEA